MKNLFIALFLLIAFTVNSQSKKDFTLLTNAEWINKDLDYLRFDDGLVVSNINDTKQQLLFDIKNRKLSFKVKYRVGSEFRTEKFDFKIKQLEKDKLVIVPLKNNHKNSSRLNSSPFLKENQYVFYNRGQLISKLKFKKVTFHSSTCFGTCASLSIEVNNDGAIKYQGRRYTKKFTGNFIGQLTENELYQFKKILNRSQLKVLDQKWKQNTAPNDSPRYNYIIELTNGRLVEINTNDQHPILDKLSDYLMNIFEVTDLKRVQNKHKFEVSNIETYRVSAY